MNQELTDMITLHGWMLGKNFADYFRISLAKTIRKAYPDAVLSQAIERDLKDEG